MCCVPPPTKLGGGGGILAMTLPYPHHLERYRHCGIPVIFKFPGSMIDPIQLGGVTRGRNSYPRARVKLNQYLLFWNLSPISVTFKLFLRFPSQFGPSLATSAEWKKLWLN